MKYYKVISGQNFIGIATTSDMRKIQTRHNILIACTEKEAQCVQVDEAFYHAGWMKSIDNISTEIAEVIEITKEEYDQLYEMIKDDEDITVDPDTDVDNPTEDEEDIPTVVTVEYARKIKISEMSKVCENTITNGVDVVLSDGETHHFSLSVQDQLNLITLSSMVTSEQDNFPYHADGELCAFYSAQDIQTIINAATMFKTYHTTYFNSLRVYVQSLCSVDTISKVEYGMKIPEKYQSDVLKELTGSDEN